MALDPSDVPNEPRSQAVDRLSRVRSVRDVMEPPTDVVACSETRTIPTMGSTANATATTRTM